LTRVETAATDYSPSTATEFDYDDMGRVVKHRQYIGTNEFAMEYGYNLAGQLTSEKYPSGKIVATSYDDNGRLDTIADQNRTYVSGITYGNVGGGIYLCSPCIFLR
jgi:YD repeat-containing protein